MTVLQSALAAVLFVGGFFAIVGTVREWRRPDDRVSGAFIASIACVGVVLMVVGWAIRTT